MKLSQFIYLIKQELRRASRSRYAYLTFIGLPLFIWVLQGGILLFTETAISESQDVSNVYLHITTNDTYGPIDVPEFKLSFDYNGQLAGSNISRLKLDHYLIQKIKWVSIFDNTSPLYGVNVRTQSYSSVESSAKNGDIRYWLHINENFTTSYISQGRVINDEVELRYLPQGILGPMVIQTGLNLIVDEAPFTIIHVNSYTSSVTKKISLGDEIADQDSKQEFRSSFLPLMIIIIAVMAPAPFISTSFSGEREKKTMESLLALPITRQSILIGKLLAGMGLVIVFTVMNLVGMSIYNAIVPDHLGRIELSYTNIIAISISMFLSAFISLSIGISIASLIKDSRTAESIYTFSMMIPALILALLTISIGLPEEFGILGLFLYIIPWQHTIAIFQRIMRPSYYSIKSIFGLGLVVDLIFHLVTLFIIIGIVLYIGAKLFNREGIVS
ncbi:MAG: ABC transporter permease [Candidatus Hodarchaeales archaeon]